MKMLSWSDKATIKKIHSKIYVGNLLIKMYYPNIITFLAKYLGAEEAAERLFQIGLEVGRKLLEIRDPKTTDIKKVIERFYKIMWNSTKGLKIKQSKQGNKTIFQVIDKACGICDPETAIEDLHVPCRSIAGYLAACMEYLSNKKALQSFNVYTVKSVSIGNSYCEHHVEVVR